jgi:hypothetical protein
LDSLREREFGLKEFHPSRKSKESGYFIRQYTHLLTAVAHEFESRPSPESGICRACGLLSTHAVHSKHYIDAHLRGYEAHTTILEDYRPGKT